MRKNLLLSIWLQVLFITSLWAQSSTDRQFYKEYWQSRQYIVPATSVMKRLETGSSADAVIYVKTSQELARVLPTQFGVNTPFRNGSDQLDRAALYDQAGMGSLRYPAGSGSNKYFWDGKVPADFRIELNGIDGTKNSYLKPESFVQFLHSINSEATIVVNYFYARYGATTEGTREARVKQAADYAAGFVRKMNVELGANIKNWEIGNECYGKWEEGYDVNGSIVTGKEYGEDFRVMAEAMKAVDPTIKVGVVVTREDDEWNSSVLPEVKDHADFLVVHNYFTSVKDATPQNLLNSVEQVEAVHTTLLDCVERYTGKPRDYFPVAMTEFNTRGSYNCTMLNGLFVAQVLGEVIKTGYGMVNLWVSEWNWNDADQESKGFLARNDPDQADYTPRQSYMPYYFYDKCFGDRMVEASSNHSDVKVYASTFESGEVGLVVINTSDTEKSVQLDLASAGVGVDYNKAYWYEFYANSITPGDKRFYINGQTGSTAGGGPEHYAGIAPYESTVTRNTLFNAKKYSVNFIVLESGVSVADPVIESVGVQVSISTPTQGAAIYYSTDGSEPDASSALYTGAFTAPPGAVIKAIAVKNDVSSQVVSLNIQYNVLFIAVDDLKPVLNCYGESQIVSPSIDRLADQGMVFTKAYCQWSVCGPSRASVMTGQTPDGTGIRNLKSLLRVENPQLVTLPEYFKNNGYVTAACGKVFDPRNVDEGHDSHSWAIPYTDPGDYDFPAEYGDFVKGNTYRVSPNAATECGPVGVDDDGYLDGQICQDALGKLEALAGRGDQPFFLAVGFKKPHIPFVAPEKYWDLYDRNSIELAAYQKMAVGSPEYAYHTPEPMGYTDIPDPWTYDDVEKGDDILSPDDQRRLIHGYYACVSYIDAQIGKLLDKLEEKGMTGNTVVMLYGDHGYHLGDHNQWGKHTNFENALRAPLIISAPGGVTGKNSTPVEFTDIYPTMCELAGLNVPYSTLQGASLAPLLRGEEMTGKTCAVSEYRAGGGSGYSFRTARYRLSLWFKSSKDRPDVIDWDESRIKDMELYDYENDPFETTNLAYLPQYVQVVTDLKTMAAGWWGKQYQFFANPAQQELALPFIEHFENYSLGASITGDKWLSENSMWERVWQSNNANAFEGTVVDDSGADGTQALKISITSRSRADGGDVIKLQTVDLTRFEKKQYVVSYLARTNAAGIGKAKVGVSDNNEDWHELGATYQEYFDTVTLSNGKLYLHFNNTDLVSGTNYKVWIDNLKISAAPPTSSDVGIIEMPQNDLLVYPNPVKSRLYVKGSDQIDAIYLYDLSGVCLIKKMNINYIDLQEINRGLYLLVAEVNGNRIVKRIVKE
ncbi:T9SS C-terminal target domain-containing protein [Marinilabiliaceae bacterium JC017]|nr:T9SS C-terminal target domain-containing protein [Marinilabiliaceae bacterium JC017]